MKKFVSIGLLAIINSFACYLVYKFTMFASSTYIDNIFHTQFEPSGLQLSLYILYLPFFLISSALSLIYSSYYNLSKSLCSGMLIIWFSYFIALLFTETLIKSTTSSGLYYVSLIISLLSTVYLFCVSINQIIQLFAKNKQ